MMYVAYSLCPVYAIFGGGLSLMVNSNFQDIDDMDADLFGSKKKPSSAPAQTKSYTSAVSKSDPSKPGAKLKASDTGV